MSNSCYTEFQKDNIPLVFVGVHVRRTDYGPHMTEMGMGNFVTKKYFEAAMEWMQIRYIERKVIFVMVSDDPDWARKMFDQRGDVVFSSSGYRYTSLSVHSCEHHRSMK